ncbi:hypothetical protein OY671_008377, partial [Metschnikowia pulcherrima]
EAQPRDIRISRGGHDIDDGIADGDNVAGCLPRRKCADPATTADERFRLPVDSRAPPGDPASMLSALGLSLGQLADRRISRVSGKSALVTLASFVVSGASGWWGLDTAFIASGSRDDSASGAQTSRVSIAGVIVSIGVWSSFRSGAIAVVQFFADEVVAAVEARHYPAFAATARPSGWRAEARQASRGGRSAPSGPRASSDSSRVAFFVSWKSYVSLHNRGNERWIKTDRDTK